MEIRVSELEYKSRSNVLEIAGIPQKNGEQPIEIVRRVAAAAGVKVQHSDVGEVTRITDRRNQAPPKLLVKFLDTRIRDVLLEKRKDINYNSIQDLATDSIFIGEDISPYHKEILWKAKQIAKEKKYQYVWIKKGQIMLRRAQNEKIVYIKHLDDLNKII